MRKLWFWFLWPLPQNLSLFFYWMFHWSFLSFAKLIHSIVICKSLFAFSKSFSSIHLGTMFTTELSWRKSAISQRRYTNFLFILFLDPRTVWSINHLLNLSGMSSIWKYWFLNLNHRLLLAYSLMHIYCYIDWLIVRFRLFRW